MTNLFSRDEACNFSYWYDFWGTRYCTEYCTIKTEYLYDPFVYIDDLAPKTYTSGATNITSHKYSSFENGWIFDTEYYTNELCYADGVCTYSNGTIFI